MQFSLKKYITEKYLTERLQSDTVIHDILNDKGKMFTYYKQPYPGTMYKKALDQFEILNDIISNTFPIYSTEAYDSYSYQHESIKTDEQKKALHSKYMQILELYKDYTSKLFIKPDPQVLSSVILSNADGTFPMHKLDLFNLTDENFKKYTVSDLKKNKDLKQYINEYAIFWFNSEGKILVVSVYGRMVLFAIDNENITFEDGRIWQSFQTNKLTPEIIEDACRKDNLIVNNLTQTLKDGTVLTYPTVGRLSRGGDKRELCGIGFVKNFLDLSKYINAYGNFKKKLQKVGANPYSKSSKLNKFTGWGNSNDDYFIVYIPESGHKDYDGNVISTKDNGKRKMDDSNLKGYNEFKFDTEKTRQRKLDFEEQQRKIYKWTKDILGKYHPYAGGKSSELFAFGRKLESYDYEKLYGTDDYCNKIARANILRYKKLIAQNRSKIGISNFNKELKEILPQLQAFTQTGKVLCNEIKNIYRNDVIKFKSLMMLYGVYSKLLNNMLQQYGNIQIAISSFKDTYANNKEDAYMSTWAKEQKLKRCQEDSNQIKIRIRNIKELCNELSSMEQKINETLNN